MTDEGDTEENDDEEEDEEEEEEEEDEEEEDGEVHNDGPDWEPNDDNDHPPPVDQNTSRVELVVSESDKDTDLPISDNTTIPSHDRLCSKTAANARDALSLAWPKMDRRTREKFVRKYIVHQQTDDQLKEYIATTIERQCNNDETALFSGAATLVSWAKSEETPNNSSDSE